MDNKEFEYRKEHYLEKYGYLDPSIRRQKIIDILLKTEMSARELANHFKVTLHEIIDDLKAIEMMIKPKRLINSNAFCRNCNYIFKEARIKAPLKCPKCKAEWIEEPKQRIE